MKRILFAFVVLIVVMLAIGTIPVHAQEGDPTANPTSTPVVDPPDPPSPPVITPVDPAPSLSVSWVSWIILHVVAALSALLAVTTAGVSIWSSALAQANRQTERLAVIENLAKSAPKELIDVVRLLAAQIAKVSTVAKETAELADKLTDGKVDWRLNGDSTPPPDPLND